eukprot:2212930-Prymnesium_polylepis.2
MTVAGHDGRGDRLLPQHLSAGVRVAATNELKPRRHELIKCGQLEAFAHVAQCVADAKQVECRCVDDLEAAARSSVGRAAVTREADHIF